MVTLRHGIPTETVQITAYYIQHNMTYHMHHIRLGYGFDSKNF